MAIYHFSVKMIRRSQGESVVFKAAYRAGESLMDKRLGKEADYSKRRGLLYQEIIYPPNAPDWIREGGRQGLWNTVEASEKREDAQVAREVEVSLPHELTLSQNIDLVKGFVEKEFVSWGMIADITINTPPKTYKGQPRQSDPRNAFAQILLTLREIDQSGFGKKDRSWNSRKKLDTWRAEWANHVNLALEKAGKLERVDHRSLATQDKTQKKFADNDQSWKQKYTIVPVRKEHQFLIKSYEVFLRRYYLYLEPELINRFEELVKTEPKKSKAIPKEEYEEYIEQYQIWANKVNKLQLELLDKLNSFKH